MNSRELCKIVYVDDGKTKVVKGYIVSDEPHLYKVKGYRTDELVVIGKSALVSVTKMEEK